MVVGKATDTQVTQTQSPTGYEAPTHWAETMEDSKLCITVDAQVTMPDVDHYPIYTTMPLAFTQAQADKIIASCFGDVELKAGGWILTKAEWEEMLLKFQKDQAEYQFADPMSDAEYQANIQYFMKRIRQAPEEPVEAEATTSFREAGERQIISLRADVGRDMDASLMIQNADEGYDASATFRRGKFFNPIVVESRLTLSREEAIQEAQAVIRSMGVEGMAVAQITMGTLSTPEGDDQSAQPQCYLVSFTPTMEGIPMTYDGQDGDSISDDTVSRVWAYEHITVGVDDQGITQMEWMGQSQVTGCVTPSTTLLPFDQIKGRVLQGLKTHYVYSEDDETTRIELTELRLGLMRIKVAGGDYHIVPVWDCFGTVSGGRSTAGQSLLTINAVDGSIIDRSVGY